MPKPRTIHKIGKYRISNRIEERKDLAGRYGAGRAFVVRGDMMPSGTLKDLRNAALLKKFSKRDPLVIPQITSGNSGRSLALLAGELDPGGERIKLINISSEEMDEKVKTEQGKEDTYQTNLGNGRVYIQFMRELARQHLNMPNLPDKNIIGVEQPRLPDGYSTIVEDIYAQLEEEGVRPTHISCPLGAGELLAEVGRKSLEVYGGRFPAIIGNTISRNPFAGKRDGSDDANFACMLADKLVTDVSNYMLEIENLKTGEGILRIKTILSGKDLKQEYEFLESLGISAEPSAATAFCGIKDMEFSKDDVLVIICSGKGNFNPEVLNMEGHLGNLGTGTDTLLEYSAVVETNAEKARAIRGRELIEAVNKSDYQAFNMLMAMRRSNRGSVSLEEQDSKGNTPLCLAASKGFDVFTADLIKHGANISATNNEGKTPLMLACLQQEMKTLGEKRGKIGLEDLVMAYLVQDLEGNTDPLIDEEYGKDKNYRRVVCNLLEEGAGIFQRDFEGRGMLLSAIEGEDRQIITVVLTKTRELLEEEMNELEELEELEKKRNVAETFYELMGALDWSGSDKNEVWEKIKNKFLKLFENQGSTSPLARAIEKDKRELAEDLINWTIFLEGNPFQMQENGWSVLIPAIEKGEEDALFVLNRIMNYTINEGEYFHINRKYRGSAPLHLVARMEGKKTKDIVGLMVELGANVEKEDKTGKLPVEIAISSMNDEAAALLVDLGEKKHEENMKRYEEAIKASNCGDMDELKRLMGKMDITRIPKSVNSRLLFKILKRAKEEKRKMDLIYECIGKFNENTEAETGELSFAGGLHPLVEMNDYYDWDYQDRLNFTHSPPYILRKMIELGVDLEETDSEGRSALIYAIEAGLEEAAIMLVKGGANPDVTNNKGETALEIAEKKRMDKLRKYLDDPDNIDKREKTD